MSAAMVNFSIDQSSVSSLVIFVRLSTWCVGVFDAGAHREEAYIGSVILATTLKRR
jgi:hypothetical protein